MAYARARTLEIADNLLEPPLMEGTKIFHHLYYPKLHHNEAAYNLIVVIGALLLR